MPTKLSDLLKSRKFWALVAALAATLTAYLSGQLAAGAAIQAAIAALAAYMIGTGLDQGVPPAGTTQGPADKSIHYESLPRK